MILLCFATLSFFLSFVLVVFAFAFFSRGFVSWFVLFCVRVGEGGGAGGRVWRGRGKVDVKLG